MDLSKIKWITAEGPDSDIAISSRVRLARNLKDIPFPHLLDSHRADEVIKKAGKVLSANPVLAKDSELYELANISQSKKEMLVELHMISPELANSTKGAVIVNNDESMSIMINEEDHLRIQTVFPGLQLENAFDFADKIDDVFEERLNYAFDENIGYLTACPTNVGTGMRASVMLHLPVLSLTEKIGPIFSTISQLGIVVRGLFGEGTRVTGDLYQISNQITLGKTEKDIVQNVTSVAKQIIQSERKIRDNLSKEIQYRLEDKILRSYGILTNAKLITTKEAMSLISDVRLGIDLGIITNSSLKDINSLFIATGPAYIDEMAQRPLTDLEREQKRAEFIKNQLTKKMR